MIVFWHGTHQGVCIIVTYLSVMGHIMVGRCRIIVHIVGVWERLVFLKETSTTFVQLSKLVTDELGWRFTPYLWQGPISFSFWINAKRRMWSRSLILQGHLITNYLNRVLTITIIVVTWNLLAMQIMWIKNFRCKACVMVTR